MLKSMSTSFEELILEEIKSQDFIFKNLNFEEIKSLLDRGADINSVDGNGNTLLMRAIKFYIPDLELIKFLLDRGASVEVKNYEGDIALFLAIKTLNSSIFKSTSIIPEIVKLLLEKNASVKEGNSNGDSALIQVFKTLYFFGSTSDILKIIEYLFDKGASVNDIDQYGNDLIFLTLKSFNPDSEKIIKLLLEKGLLIDAVNNDGKTALIEAVNSYNPNKEIIELLVELSSDIGNLSVLKFAIKFQDLFDLCLNKGLDVHNSHEGQILIKQEIILSIENLNFTNANYLYQFLTEKNPENIIDFMVNILQDDLIKSHEIYKYQAVIHLFGKAFIDIDSNILQYKNDPKQYHNNYDFKLVENYLPALIKYYLNIARNHLIENLIFKDDESKLKSLKVIEKLFNNDNFFLENFYKLNDLLATSIDIIDTEIKAEYFVINNALQLISDDYVKEVNILSGVKTQILDKDLTVFRGMKANINTEQIENIFIYGHKAFNQGEYNVFGYHTKHDWKPTMNIWWEYGATYVSLDARTSAEFAIGTIGHGSNNLLFEINLSKNLSVICGHNGHEYELAINLIKGENIKAIYELDNNTKIIKIYKNPYYKFEGNLTFDLNEITNLPRSEGIENYNNLQCQFQENNFENYEDFLNRHSPRIIETLRNENCEFHSLDIQGQCKIVKNFIDYNICLLK